MAISDQLTLLNNTKQAIKTSINNKGGSVTDSTPFADYSTAIDNLPSGGDNSTLIDLIERDITTLNIPSGTTRIGDNAFYNFSTLRSITISNTVTSIGNNAFENCSALSNVIIGNGVTTIGSRAFYNNRAITSIDIPNSVTSIGNGAFQLCSFLTSVTIPSSIKSIASQIFKSCSSLTNVTIPSGVTTIGDQAFMACTSLQTVIVNATTPPTLGSSVFDSTNDCPIYVPASSVDTYKAANNWSTLASRIFAIEQVATVDGNPVYNYELGNTDSTTILSTEILKMPTGTSIEFAEGITNIGGSISGYTTVTLPSTFATFNDQNMIGSSVTTLTMKSTTPPTAERNNLGGAGLTAIYVPASAVDTYKAAPGWSNFASIIEGISSPSITITEYEGQAVIDNAIDFGEQFGYDGDEVVVDSFAAASSNSTFDSDLKAANIIVVEDDNGNDITSQCTFTSPDFSRWDSTQDPEYDGESEAYYKWQAVDTIASGDSQMPGSVSITATYGRFTDTLSLEYSKTDETPQPEPDPEEPEE